MHRLWQLFSLTCTVSDVFFLWLAPSLTSFLKKVAKSSFFFNAHWEIWPKNCSKTRKFRKFEQNIGQISYCAYQNFENLTFFPVTFRHDGVHLWFYQEKTKIDKIRLFSRVFEQKMIKIPKIGPNLTHLFAKLTKTYGFTQEKKRELTKLGFF